jgi:hypothetical protein
MIAQQTKKQFFPKLLTAAVVLLLQSFLPNVVQVAHASPPSGVDLDVTYISRTPRYSKYRVDYDGYGNPYLLSGTENDKRWPDVNETVTYTAHVINKGTTSFTGSVTYQWKVDGSVVSSGTYNTSLASAAEATFTYSNAFPSTPQSIQFVMDSGNAQTETFENNNSLTVGSHDLTLTYYVETPIYNIFNDTANLNGTYSFEDWVQAQIGMMNQRFADSTYTGLAPNGVKSRVRIDKIVIDTNLDGSNTAITNDPDRYLVDGLWQTVDNDSTNNTGNNGAYQDYVNRYATSIDWGLIHEVGHQLGIIDLYRVGIAGDDVNTPSGISVTDINGQTLKLDNLPLPMFTHPGLYAAGDTSPHNDGTYFESHTVGGLNSNHPGNTPYRRGYFGEYQFDTPSTTSVRLLDNNGAAITNASVAFYQKDQSEHWDNYADLSGTTDGSGVLTLANRSVNGVTTATGHTLAANPFGQIDVAGRNGAMIVKVTKNNQEGYGFFFLQDLNIEYWKGNTGSVQLDLKTNYPKVTANSTLGYTTIGSNTDSDDSNTMNATKFTVGAHDITTTYMSVYVGSIASSPNNKYQVAIYTDNNGNPNTKVASSAEATLTANSWNTVALTANLNANSTYWLAYNTNGSSSSVNNMKYDSGTTSQSRYASQTYGTWPSSFGSSNGENIKYSIYLIYVDTQAPTPTPASHNHIQSKIDKSNNYVSSKSVTLDSSVASANLVVVAVSAYSNGTANVSSVTDNKGNTYTKAVAEPSTASGHDHVSIWYAKNVTGGSSFTVTANAPSGNNEYLTVAAHEYSGASTTVPLDRTTSASGISQGIDTGATADTTQAEELIFSAFTHQSSTDPSATAGRGYTKRQSITNGTYMPLVTEDRVLTNVGPAKGLLFWGEAVGWRGVVATFK